MANLRDLPVASKLTQMIWATCGTALLVMATASLIHRAVTHGQGSRAELALLARGAAAGCAPALSAGQPAVAKEILAVFAKHPQVLSVTVERTDQTEFAHYKAAKSSGSPDIKIEEPIWGVGRVGTLKLAANKDPGLMSALWTQGAILGGAFLLAMGVALLLGRPWRESIVNPVLELTQTVESVVLRHDYRVRAEVTGSDEIGVLAERFNRTLGRIEALQGKSDAQDNAVRRAEREKELAERERRRAESSLESNRQRYEVAAVTMLGSNEGVWDWDLATNKMHLSPRWKKMLGFEDHELENTYEVWASLLYSEDRERVLKQVDDYLAGHIPAFEVEYRLRCKQADAVWVLARGAALRDSSGKPYRFAGAQSDITARKMAEAGLEQLHRQMIETSRFAGMAEIATGVLHNVGNVLNSVNVSATVLSDRLRDSKVPDLAAAAGLFKERAGDLPAFLTADPKGRVLPGYLRAGLEKLGKEREEMLKELESLHRNIEHIKEVVAMQQTYARISAPTETMTAAELIEEALRLNEATFASQPIEVVRRFHPVPEVAADRHKAVQILINLLSNARHAMADVPAPQRRMEIIIETNERGAVTIAVRDNGTGISPDNLTRIFGHGFTTRKDGHGFGLHSSANAAKAMGGSLAVWSDGPGKGACFVLEMPAASPAAELKAA